MNDRFRLVDTATGKPWAVPAQVGVGEIRLSLGLGLNPPTPLTQGSLKCKMVMQPALSSALEVTNATGLSGLITLMINTRVARMTLLELTATDTCYHVAQLVELVTAINASPQPFSKDEMVEVCYWMLPKALDVSSIPSFLESYLDNKQHRELQNRLKSLYPLLCGVVCGAYSLDLSKTLDRSVCNRLMALAEAERMYNLTQRAEGDGGRIDKPRGTGDRGRWSSFRNVVLNKEPSTQPLIDRYLRTCMHRDSRATHLSAQPISFDFATVTRAPAGATPISEQHLTSIFQRCNLDLSEPDQAEKGDGGAEGAGEGGGAGAATQHVPWSETPESRWAEMIKRKVKLGQHLGIENVHVPSPVS